MRTWANSTPGSEEYRKRHPWNAPGTTLIFSGCGIGGGNPDGCREHEVGELINLLSGKSFTVFIVQTWHYQ